jgi:hypothetical protein
VAEFLRASLLILLITWSVFCKMCSCGLARDHGHLTDIILMYRRINGV